MNLFESHEEAEAMYKKLAEVYLNTMLYHQVTTAFYMGCFEAVFDTIQAQDKAGKEVEEADKVMLSFLNQVIVLRNQELHKILQRGMKGAPGGLPIPDINGPSFIALIKEKKAHAKNLWSTLANKEEREGTIDSLMAKIKENADKMGLDSESPET